MALFFYRWASRRNARPSGRTIRSGTPNNAFDLANSSAVDLGDLSNRDAVYEGHRRQSRQQEAAGRCGSEVPEAARPRKIEIGTTSNRRAGDGGEGSLMAERH